MSAIRLKAMTRQANTKVTAMITGVSLARIELISSEPMPGTRKICSVTIAPPNTAGICNATSVTTGMSALRSLHADRQRDQQRKHLRGADDEQRGGQALENELVHVHPAHEGEPPVAIEHGGEPAQVAHEDRVIEPELQAQRGAHLRRHRGV